MKNNLYIDNIISEEAIILYYTESTWASNSIKLQEQSRNDHMLDWHNSQPPWIKVEHMYRYTLQASSKQYDPLRWLSPITVHAKLLIQELWRQTSELGWAVEWWLQQ